ncbi:MauE/DoxX family redox-associated membrane protein, partial [Mesonia sp. K4-1]|uniref:MauE/DoxX family redox-associated membrane protein n=1 Tax=Mesonia sp. K4-1 TaxID=2602760 RepID=UPI00164FB82A
NSLVILISILVLLFTYIGINQLIFRDDFELNLLNSSLLPIPEMWVSLLSWFIPLLELLAVFLLLWVRSQYIGIYLAIFLLLMYTCYNLGILYIAPYIPCSCGGMLGFLSWQQQLWVSLGGLMIAILTFYFNKTVKKV